MPSPIIYLEDASITMRPAGTGTATPYEGSVMTAEVTSEPGDENSVVTLDGVRHVRFGTPAYALHLVMAQDWTGGGLCTFLWNNAGEQIVWTLQAHGQNVPAAAGTPIMTGICIGMEPTYGGEAETWIQAEVEMPCIDRPILQTAPGELLATFQAERAADVRMRRFTDTIEQAPEPQPEPQPAAA